MVTLDAHGEMLLEQYRQRLSKYENLEQLVYNQLDQILRQQGIYVTAVEHRIKKEESLEKKLELKGAKYRSLDDITDILGFRIVTFYTDDVDKVAVIVKRLFDVDWSRSVDKRKLHQLDSFGYNSLHYICRLRPEGEYKDMSAFFFEIQMRTALQHAWSTIEHSLGYKNSVQMPHEYRRQFSRLAGMLELVDDEFSRLRTTLTDYRRHIKTLVASGQLDEVPLNIDTFRSYLELHPFDRLNRRIAAVNQAEICPVSLMPFLPVLEQFGMETLGDINNFISQHADDAYQLALTGLAVTDLDILAENIGIQNLCFVYQLKKGEGKAGLKKIFDIMNGERESNDLLAEAILAQAATLPFMKKTKE